MRLYLVALVLLALACGTPAVALWLAYGPAIGLTSVVVALVAWLVLVSAMPPARRW